MKPSLHSLIHFLPFLLNYSANCQLRRFVNSLLQLPTPKVDSILSPATSGGPTGNTASSIVACCFIAAEMCLPHRCVAARGARTTENMLFYCCPAFASAGMCLPSSCLAVNYSDFQASCHNIENVQFILVNLNTGIT
jgi:hypothetical protein